MVYFKKKLEKLHYDMSHIKCSKCKKVAFVPYIPNEYRDKLNLVYPLYVNSYLHYHYNWHTLRDDKHSHICPECYKGEEEFKTFDKKLSELGQFTISDGSFGCNSKSLNIPTISIDKEFVDKMNKFNHKRDYYDKLENKILEPVIKKIKEILKENPNAIINWEISDDCQTIDLIVK